MLKKRNTDMMKLKKKIMGTKMRLKMKTSKHLKW